MGKITVHFGDRTELDRLDKFAAALGGVRASAEWRPCYGFLRGVDKPHSVTYHFAAEETARAFGDAFGARKKLTL